MKHLTPDYLEKFKRLYLRLEPENLHMDGEATRSEVIQRERQIKAEWLSLELQVGFRVPYDELEKLIHSQWKQQA